VFHNLKSRGIVCSYSIYVKDGFYKGMRQGSISGKESLQLFLKKPAVKAAAPPTNPPINAVARIIAKDDPPRGNISAIFPESRCSFFISINQARNAHKIKTPVNPAKKAFQFFMGINNTEINEAIAILHHGR